MDVGQVAHRHRARLRRTVGITRSPTACVAAMEGRACCRFQSRRREVRTLVWTAAIALLTGSLTAHAEPVRIAHTVWVSFGPLSIAQEKGFFVREGVEVELIRIEEHTTTYAGLYSGQIDAVAAAFQDAPAFSDLDEAPLVCVLMLDDSRGANGSLAS